jgi:uncharacterized membrane protein
MSDSTTAALTGVLVLSAAIWIGGLVAIAVVAKVATSTLDATHRVAFFRGLGRTYAVVGTAALIVGYGTGATLLYGRDWDVTLTVTVVVAIGLAVILAAGMTQARRMTRLRRYALEHEDDADVTARVRRGAARAGALRGFIALLSLTLLALGVLLGS